MKGMLKGMEGWGVRVGVVEGGLEELVGEDLKGEEEMGDRIGVRLEYMEEGVEGVWEDKGMVGEGGWGLGNRYGEMREMERGGMVGGGVEVKKEGVERDGEMMVGVRGMV